jgi:hypothetical protein
MNADSYFEMGRTHLVCQDYAFASDPDPDLGWLTARPYVVVSDGCSSSLNTDFGSRLMALSAAREMDEFGPDAPVELDGKKIIAGAVLMAEALGLHITALDATVMVAWVEQNTIRVLVWGDGVVAGRYRHGLYRLHTIEFAHSAPAYLTYSWDESRQAVYREHTEDGLHTVYTTDQEDNDPIARGEARTGLEPVEFSFPIEDFDLVVLLSDGIETCHIPVEDAVEKVLAVKNYDGRFITRRVRRFLKQLRADGNNVDDDLGVGALYCPIATLDDAIIDLAAEET